jgi:hypothetical protein
MSHSVQHVPGRVTDHWQALLLSDLSSVTRLFSSYKRTLSQNAYQAAQALGNVRVQYFQCQGDDTIVDVA